MGIFLKRVAGLSLFFIAHFLFGSVSARADISDVPADGSFAFLDEGSLVVSFYQDRINGDRQEQKYLSFDLGRGGAVSGVDVTRSSDGGGWVRGYARRIRSVPPLADYLGAGRWQSFQNQVATVLAHIRSPGGNRFHFLSSVRARQSAAFDPANDRSYSISMISGGAYPMRREIYDVDGIRATTGQVRESWRNPEQASRSYEAALKLIVFRLRGYLNTYFPAKKS